MKKSSSCINHAWGLGVGAPFLCSNNTGRSFQFSARRARQPALRRGASLRDASTLISFKRRLTGTGRAGPGGTPTRDPPPGRPRSVWEARQARGGRPVKTGARARRAQAVAAHANDCLALAASANCVAPPTHQRPKDVGAGDDAHALALLVHDGHAAPGREGQAQAQRGLGARAATETTAGTREPSACRSWSVGSPASASPLTHRWNLCSVMHTAASATWPEALSEMAGEVIKSWRTHTHAK